MNNMRVVQFAAVLALAFASDSMASLIGSTYTFSDSTTGATTIVGTGPGFCIGPNEDNCHDSGLFGGFSFADLDPTDGTITFSFSGSTDETNGSFMIDLNNLTTPDGSIITGITYGSGNLLEGDFSAVTWDGTNAAFTGTADGGYDAVQDGGVNIVFDVALQPAASAPEPASIWLSGLGLAGLAFFATRRRVRT